MAATIILMTKKQEKVINELHDCGGIILVTERMAEKLNKEYSIPKDSLDGTLIEYDFEGYADIWVDTCKNSDAWSYLRIVDQFTDKHGMFVEDKSE